MDDNIGDMHGSRMARRDARGAADTVRHQRCAQFAGLQNFLDFAVIRVKAAHKAHLYQRFSRFFFRLDDGSAVFQCGCERFFTEYRFVCGDAFAGQVGMSCIPCGDNNGIDVRGLDQLLGGCLADCAILCGDGIALFTVDVINRADADALDDGGQALEMILTDEAACADNADGDNLRMFHVGFLLCGKGVGVSV